MSLNPNTITMLSQALTRQWIFSRSIKHFTFVMLNKLRCHFIMKTCQYNFDLLKPHFYIVKLGFTGVYIIFLISSQKHKLWVLVRTEAVLTSTHNLCFEQKYEKISELFYLKICSFLEVKFSIYLNRQVFVM